jgi:hypothetical protein
MLSKSLKKNWLTNELNQVISGSDSLKRFFNQALNPLIFSEKLIGLLCDYIFEQLSSYLKREIQSRISEQCFDWSNDFKQAFEEKANENSISKRNYQQIEQRKWKHLKVKIGAVKKFKEKNEKQTNISCIDTLNIAKKYVCANLLNGFDQLLNEILLDFLSQKSQIFQDIRESSQKNKEFKDKNSDLLKSDQNYSNIIKEYQNKLVNGF